MIAEMVIFIGILASNIFLVLGQIRSENYGSSEATLRDFSFQVSVCDRNEHICGGVILDNYHILTAADCFRNPPHKIRTDLKVLAGPDDVHDSNHTGHFYDIYLIIFPDEISGYAPNLAVVKLTSKIEFSTLRQSVNLPKWEHRTPLLITTGWGNSTHRNQQHNLKKFYLNVWPDIECRNHSQHSRIIHPDEVCASSSLTKPNARNMIYKGSPVFDHRKRCKGHTIIGIISVSPLELSNPIIYINVFHHVQWIKRAMVEFKEIKYDLSV